MGKRDRIIEVAAQIKALRDELRRLEGELDRLMADLPGEVSPRVGAAADSLPSKVLVFLDAHFSVVFTAAEVAVGLETDNEKAIGSALGRLWKARKIKRIGRGQYAALAYTPPAMRTENPPLALAK